MYFTKHVGWAFVASLISAGATASPSAEALIGRNVTGHAVDGWTVETSHSWCVSNEFNPDCLMVQLRNGRTMVVALTHPTQRSPSGGVQAETIYRAFPVELPEGVELAECRDVQNKPAVLGWLDRRSKTATIFTTDGRSLRRTSIKYSSEEPCEIGED